MMSVALRVSSGAANRMALPLPQPGMADPELTEERVSRLPDVLRFHHWQAVQFGVQPAHVRAGPVLVALGYRVGDEPWRYLGTREIRAPFEECREADGQARTQVIDAWWNLLAGQPHARVGNDGYRNIVPARAEGVLE